MFSVYKKSLTLVSTINKGYNLTKNIISVDIYINK